MNNFNSYKLFSNKAEELEFYKNKYISNIRELLKCQLKIKNLENSNQKLQKKFTEKQSATNNKLTNLSSLFLSPNEFKKLWESIISTELIEVFDFCIPDYILISNLCQDIVLLIYNETNKIINYKLNDILKCMNLEKISSNKKNEIFSKFQSFFQDNFNYIFVFNDTSINEINNKLITVIKEYTFTENEKKEQLLSKISSGHFNEFYKSFYRICIYMLLHESSLTFNIEKYNQRKPEYYFFDNYNFINVDGFGNSSTPCIILLKPPLLKNKFPFNGLKPAVYVLEEYDEKILDICKSNVNNINKEKNSNVENNNNFFNNNCELIYENNNNRLTKHIDEKQQKNEISNLTKLLNETKNKKRNVININNNNYEMKKINIRSIQKINKDKSNNKSTSVSYVLINNNKNHKRKEKELSFIFNDNSSNYNKSSEKDGKQNNIIELSTKKNNINNKNKNNINKSVLNKLNLINGEIYSYNIDSNATQSNETNRTKNKKNKSENIRNNIIKYKKFICDNKIKCDKYMDDLTSISNNQNNDPKQDNYNNTHKKSVTNITNISIFENTNNKIDKTPFCKKVITNYNSTNNLFFNNYPIQNNNNNIKEKRISFKNNHHNNNQTYNLNKNQSVLNNKLKEYVIQNYCHKLYNNKHKDNHISSVSQNRIINKHRIIFDLNNTIIPKRINQSNPKDKSKTPKNEQTLQKNGKTIKIEQNNKYKSNNSKKIYSENYLNSCKNSSIFIDRLKTINNSYQIFMHKRKKLKRRNHNNILGLSLCDSCPMNDLNDYNSVIYRNNFNNNITINNIIYSSVHDENNLMDYFKRYSVNNDSYYKINDKQKYVMTCKKTSLSLKKKTLQKNKTEKNSKNFLNFSKKYDFLNENENYNNISLKKTANKISDYLNKSSHFSQKILDNCLDENINLPKLNNKTKILKYNRLNSSNCSKNVYNKYNWVINDNNNNFFKGKKKD